MKESTLSNINGDTVKSFWGRLFYFYQCKKNCRHGPDSGIKLKKNLTLICDNSNLLVGTPARILCNLYWKTLDFTKIYAHLSDKVNILDLGCGSGRYGYAMEEYSGDYFGSYTGLDIYFDKNYPEKFSHILENAVNCTSDHLKNINFVLSQSSLEHIDEDFKTLFNITKILNDSGKKFLTIHQIPAESSLYLYGWHGWRQYSLRNLNHISRRLRDSFNLHIYAIPLGGAISFNVQIKRLLIMKLLSRIFSRLNKDTLNNIESLNHKILKDLKCNSSSPLFWTLVIANFDATDIYKVTPND